MPAPVLTVLVPVYRVEPYLRQCLDSILLGAPAGVELVAIDDASPDGCGAILDNYAATDPRVRVLHLPTNGGLGPARNAGLAVARGDYVWFVDSDDWLPPGTTTAVVEAVGRSRPDVLVLDHLRVYASGPDRPDPSSDLLHAWPAGHVAPLSDRPELLGLQHTAWNKVVRRDFLTRLGLTFHPGYYEDYPFSHPVLLAAERIAVLDRVSYYYRQREAGEAITTTPGRRHLDAFDQYERLFAQLDSWGPEFDRWRPRLFELMINHLIVIVGNDRRVPYGLRREFFRRMSEFYRRYHPGTGPAAPTGPRGIGGVKHWLVRRDAFRGYAVLRWCYRTASGLRAERPPGPWRAPTTPALARRT